jgi:hypothetical protein
MGAKKSPAGAGLSLERTGTLALVATLVTLIAGFHRDFGIPFFALVWHITPHGTVFFDSGCFSLRQSSMVSRRRLNKKTYLIAIRFHVTGPGGLRRALPTWQAGHYQLRNSRMPQ